MKSGALRLKKHKTFFLFLLAALFASCASAPRVSFAPEQENPELSILPAGARVYLWVDAVNGRPLINALSSVYFSGDDLSDVLDNTYYAAAALSTDQSQGRRFFLAASGRYPRFMANFSLMFSKGWKRQRSVTGGSFWYSANNNIALALGSNLALVSDVDPYEDFSYETVPAGFAEFMRGSALAGWVNGSSEFINNFLSSMGIPLQVPAEDFFFSAVSSQDSDPQNQGRTTDWDLALRIRTSSPAQARSLVTLFSMARLFVMRGPQSASEEDNSMSPLEAARLLFANSPQLDGDAIVLRVGPLEETRIALLFSMFSVYSN